MLSLEQLRKIDPTLRHMQDSELEAVRDELYKQAELMFDVWISKENSSKNPLGSFTSASGRSKI